MGKAVLVCRDCGKELALTDKFCSQCGAKVEEDVVHQHSATVTPDTPCEICGHVNASGGQYCEACGATLLRHGKSAREKKPLNQVTPKKQRENLPSRFKFQTWHYVAGALLLGLIGVFVYIELQRENPAGAGQQQQVSQMQFPAAQTPSTPPSQEILDAIARLEKTVQDSPNDVGARLLLANALHDGAIHDGSLFPRAIDAYKKYLKTKPGDPNARVDLGICYFELGKIDSTQSATLFSMAIDEMEAAVKSSPSHQAGAFNLGIVYLYSGNLKESNKWLQKTVELNAESDLGKRAKAILEQHNQAG